MNDNKHVYDKRFYRHSVVVVFVFVNEKLFLFAQAILFIFSSHRKFIKQKESIRVFELKSIIIVICWAS